MAQPAQASQPEPEYIPYPESPADGAVRDLRSTPTEHLWIWMRRLQAHMTMSTGRQVRDSRTVARRLQSGEDAAELAEEV